MKKQRKLFGLVVVLALAIVLMVQYNNFKKDYINLNDVIDYYIEDGVLTLEVERIVNLDDRGYKAIEEYVIKRDMI